VYPVQAGGETDIMSNFYVRGILANLVMLAVLLAWLFIPWRTEMTYDISTLPSRVRESAREGSLVPWPRTRPHLSRCGEPQIWDRPGSMRASSLGGSRPSTARREAVSPHLMFHYRSEEHLEVKNLGCASRGTGGPTGFETALDAGAR
jgi:hypothetical protein